MSGLQDLSPVLPMSVSGAVASGGAPSYAGLFSQRSLWVYVVLAIVLVVILAWLAKDFKCVFASLNLPSWGDNPTVAAILIVVSLFIAAYCAFMGHASAFDANSKYMIMLAFGAIVVLYIVVFYLFFRKGNFTGAFYTSLLLLVAALFLLYTCWRTSKAAAYGVIPLVVVAALQSWWLWKVSTDNASGSFGGAGSMSWSGFGSRSASCRKGQQQVQSFSHQSGGRQSQQQQSGTRQSGDHQSGGRHGSDEHSRRGSGGRGSGGRGSGGWRASASDSDPTPPVVVV